jgi:hypothetical protein
MTQRAMTNQLDRLFDLARNVEMTAAQREAQWRSSAYGNTKIENERITRTMVDEVAEMMKRSDHN